MEIDGHCGPRGCDGSEYHVVLVGGGKQWLASDVVESCDHGARLVKEYWTSYDAGNGQHPASQEAVPDGFRPKKRKEQKAKEQKAKEGRKAKGGGSNGENKRVVLSHFFPATTDHGPASASAQPVPAPAQPVLQAAAPSRGMRMVGGVRTNAIDQVAAARDKQQKRRRVIEDSDED